VFFDFDGLILDTEWPEVETWTAIYTEHGHEFPDSVWKGAIGRGPEQDALRAETLLSRITGVSASELEAEYQKRRMVTILGLSVLPGVIDRLDEARDLGLNVVAVSSSKRSWVEGHLIRLNLWDRFEKSFCADDVTHTKPSPELYQLALRTLGLEPTQAIVFEDSPNGVAAAKAAGIRVVAIPNRLTGQLDLSAADYIAASLGEISISQFNAE
jgi:HAD superfamily hydrolase (TIGR01509 family)